MLRHQGLFIVLSTLAGIPVADGSNGAGHRRPAMHAPHTASEIIWNPIDGDVSMYERGDVDTGLHRNWADSIGADRYLEFLIRDGALPAPAPDDAEIVPAFEIPSPVRRGLESGQDVLEAVEAARSGLDAAEDPVRRWCVIGELPGRTTADASRRSNRFFLGRGRGLAGDFDFDRFNQMVFEVPAAVADRYDATGDGIPDRVVAADIGGVVVTVVERQGASAEGGSFRRGDGREDHCVLARSAVIAEWIERRRQEGY